MRKISSVILLCLAVMLTGCGGSAARESFEEFSTSLNDEAALCFTARIRAEYDDRTAEFTLDYTEDESGCVVSVVSPEMIRGVSAHITAGETALEYDGIMLDTGTLDSFGLSPMSALPLLVETMKSGYLDTAWEENDALCAVLVPSDNVSIELRLDKYTKTPLYAEISSNGRVRVFAEISAWSPTGTLIDDTIYSN